MDRCVDVMKIKRSKAQGSPKGFLSPAFVRVPRLLSRQAARYLPLIHHDRSTWRGHIDYSTRADMVLAALQIRPKLWRAEDSAPTPVAYHAAPESDDQEPVGRAAR
jgi:hypothetical protein